MPLAANGNACRNGGYYVSFNILYNACSSLTPVSYWDLCVNSTQAIFFHSTLLIQFLGFAILTTAAFKAMRKFVVRIRMDLILNIGVRAIIFSSVTFLLL